MKSDATNKNKTMKTGFELVFLIKTLGTGNIKTIKVASIYKDIKTPYFNVHLTLKEFFNELLM